MIQKKVMILLAAASLSVAFISEARNPESGKKGPPPPAAIEACQSMSESDACTIVGKNRDSLKGTCRTVPSGEFTCVPDHHKKPDGAGGKEKETGYHDHDAH
jgi:hypothetical protein